MCSDSDELKRHAGLVYKVALKFIKSYPSIPPDDIVAAGNLGLLQAIRSFDHDRGAVFSTFAFLKIRAAIIDAIRDDALIQLPDAKADQIRRLRQLLDDGATLAQAAAEIGTTTTAARKLLELFTGAASLSVPVFADEESESFVDLLPSEYPTPAEIVEQSDARGKIRAALSVLGEKHRRMLELYFGFQGDEQTYVEIAQQFGITAPGVRFSVLKSLEKLRPVLAAHHLHL